MKLLAPLALLLSVCARLGAADLALFYSAPADLRSFVQAAEAVEEPQTQPVPRLTILRVKEHTVYAVRLPNNLREAEKTARSIFSQRLDFAISIGAAGALNTAFPVGTWCWVREVVPDPAVSAREAQAETLPTPFAHVVFGEASAALRAGSALAASTNKFCADPAQRDRIRRDTRADIVEMPLHGMAGAARLQNIPLFALRVVADLADGTAEAQYATFTKGYRGEAGAALGRAVAKLPGKQVEIRELGQFRPADLGGFDAKSQRAKAGQNPKSAAGVRLEARGSK